MSGHGNRTIVGPQANDLEQRPLATTLHRQDMVAATLQKKASLLTSERCSGVADRSSICDPGGE